MNSRLDRLRIKIEETEADLARCMEGTSLPEFLDSVSYQEYLLRCDVAGKNPIPERAYDGMRKRIGI